MTVTVVVGSQWGDEGKGKITDLLARDMDVIVRYQGGNNAGHTVVIGKDTFKLHLIPSGIFYPEVLCVIGNGVVIDLAVLLQEIEELKSKGFDPESHLRISSQTHIIFPYHRLMDQAQEKKREAGRIGTTCRGIGPCYVDKINRRGIRISDLYNVKLFREKLEWNAAEKSFLLNEFYGLKETIETDKIMEEYLGFAGKIKEMVIDDSPSLVNRLVDKGQEILLEGAQGTMLDVDHGTYPYVTSSNPVAGGACVGAGLGPTKIDEVIGVVKAYVTRVGEGPFPTETPGKVGEQLRERGKEYGATTGRPRRCGWFDSVVLHYSVLVNGLTQLAITKLDVLDDLKKIKICTAYEYNGRKIAEFPADIYKLEKCKPIYEEMEGWKSDTTSIKSYNDLPANARKYLEKISGLAKVPISLISTGAERGQIIRV